MAPMRDLALLIQSRYPIVAVETLEEDRLERALEEIASSLRVPLYVWTVTTGLRRRGNVNSLYDTQAPLRALANIASLPGEGIYLLKDLHRYLDQPEVVRRLQDLAPAFAADRRVLVLSGTRVTLPAELATLAATYSLALPGVTELRALAHRVIETLSRERPVRVELSDPELDRLVDRLAGMTAFEAERALTKAILRDHSLTRADLEQIIETKKALLRKEGLLEYVAPDENLAEVGGFDVLKDWLRKRQNAFSPEAKAFGIVAPRGLLLLGVQGCLRGDTRVLLSDGRMPTLETLARQVSDCLEPGAYDVAHWVALEDNGRALATRLQIHADRATVLVRFAHARELELTLDHEVLTRTGWTRADRLRIGEEVRLWGRTGTFVTPAKRTGFGRPLHSVRLRRVPIDTLPAVWTPELAELVGLLAAEGHKDRYRVTLTLAEDELELAQWLRSRSEKLFGIVPTERARAPKHVREFRFDSFDIAVNLHPLVQGSHQTKAVPDDVFSLDDECIAGFLRALLEGDGSVANWKRHTGHPRSPRVALKTASPVMAGGVQLLLQRLGIHSRVYRQNQIHGYSRRPSYTVNIETRASLTRFASIVGFITETKRERLARGLATFTRHTRPRSADFARIVDIETARQLARVYDLTVPGAERFIANGLVVHNCGKSLVARTVAKIWGLPLLKLEVGRLYDKFIGESEKNLEKALRTAEQMAPCVLMLDEIEKALAYSPTADADAGLSRRLFGRLLGWLQDRQAPVFVVATCNDIAQLPPELTRKGRFDEIFFIDLPNRSERREIFTVHLRKRKRDPAAFDLDALVAAAEGFSGAEIEQAVVSGLTTAFSRGAELTTEVLLEELRATRPLSVTRREEIQALRDWARDRTVLASSPGAG